MLSRTSVYPTLHSSTYLVRIYREEKNTFVLVQSTPRISAPRRFSAAYFVTSRRAHFESCSFGKFNQGLSSMRTFVQPDKRSGKIGGDIMPQTLLLAVLDVAVARDCLFHTGILNSKQSPLKIWLS